MSSKISAMVARAVSFIQDGAGATSQTIADVLAEEVSIDRFLTAAQRADKMLGTAALDMTDALAKARDYVKGKGGGTIKLGRGVIRLNGVAGADGIVTGFVLPFTSSNDAGPRVRIVGQGRGTIIKAGTDNMLVLRMSDSHCALEHVTIDAQRPGVKAIGLVPENTTQAATVVHQNYNTVRDVYVIGGAEGVWFKPGPRVGGTDSGCWYNKITDVHLLGTTRAIWMAAPPNLGPQSTRNDFDNVRGGQAGMNTGLQIDNGGTNIFSKVHFEGVTTVAGPNATPTAVKIATVDAFGVANDDNHFFACYMEACTRDLDNGPLRTAIIGGYWTATKFVGTTPRVMIGTDPSVLPLTLPGIQYGEGIAGYPSGRMEFAMSVSDKDKYWQDFNLSTANVTNAATVFSPQSKFIQLGDMVDWHFSFQFKATAAATKLTIVPPVAPANTYVVRAGTNPWFSFYVEDGSGIRKPVEGGFTNDGKLYVLAPSSTWNTAGDFNAIYVAVRYHK